MKKLSFIIISLFILKSVVAQEQQLYYHTLKTDSLGKIIPWYDKDLGKSYDHAINSVWNFWDKMPIDYNGLPYYMNHQVYNEGANDPRGIGGDQLQMALSSWRLYYAYAGNWRVRENMKFLAEYYLTHSLSPATAKWPHIPYPYNTLVYSGQYDGDMVIGKNFTQPDKAGSFGHELIQLYKMHGTRGHGQTAMAMYLDAAINIANTLAKNIKEGNDQTSPLPFKVNAITGEVAILEDNYRVNKTILKTDYTTNWSGTMELFLDLIKMKKDASGAYQKSFDILLSWMKNYPLKNNKWGPFFEDIPGWSDTQINAITFAQFMMNHPEYFPNWKIEVKDIFNWVYSTVGNKTWEKYGVIVVNEQTAYQTPGNSHSARQASAELQYAHLTGDTTFVENAIRTLNWATYMVDVDGKNRYPQDEIWLTDGYGDYVRHYLRAFSYKPELAPHQDHILNSTSVIQFAEYKSSPFKRFNFNPSENDHKIKLTYQTYDKSGREVIRLKNKPSKVTFYKDVKSEVTDESKEGYIWNDLNNGGLLIINRLNANEVTIYD